MSVRGKMSRVLDLSVERLFSEESGLAVPKRSRAWDIEAVSRPDWNTLDANWRSEEPPVSSPDCPERSVCKVRGGEKGRGMLGKILGPLSGMGASFRTGEVGRTLREPVFSQSLSCCGSQALLRSVSFSF